MHDFTEDVSFPSSPTLSAVMEPFHFEDYVLNKDDLGDVKATPAFMTQAKDPMDSQHRNDGYDSVPFWFESNDWDSADPMHLREFDTDHSIFP